MTESGLSWDKITKMINESKNNGDYLANLIYDIKWVFKSLLPMIFNDRSNYKGEKRNYDIAW